MIETFQELKEAIGAYSLHEFILKSQAEDEGITESELYSYIEKVADSMMSAVQSGIKSRELSKSGLSGNAAYAFSIADIPILISDYEKKAMLYSLAVIEENARMGRIAACPTAGSAGIVPGVLIAAYEEFSKSKEELIKALIVAGEIGRIISVKMPLAGAVAGCQAECGVASAMAASGLCYMLNADIDIIFNAVALCLKNIMGLTCDPVAGLVEVPCVKRNAFLASHAINSVYIAMSGVKSVIPVDDVISAMKETGMLMSPKLKESSEAGLATTKTGITIKNDLYKNWGIA